MTPVTTPKTETHMQSTGWECRACNTHGTISYVIGASSYEALHILEDAHREASGGKCSDLVGMRVWPENAMTDRTLIIWINGNSLDVIAWYRKEGWTLIPPVPTMTGAQIKSALPGLGMGRQLLQRTGPGEETRSVADAEAVGLEDGMHFYAVPPATY